MNEPTGREHVTSVAIDTTSATERAIFRTCRRHWLLGVVNRLTGNEANKAFVLGTAIHAGLAAYYRDTVAGRPRTVAETNGLAGYHQEMEKATTVARESLGWLWSTYEQQWMEQTDLGNGMLIGYIANERLDPIGTVEVVEERRLAPIRQAGRRLGWLSAQFDLVVKRRDGMRAIVDHKTASRDHNPGQLDLNDQLTAYAWSWRATMAEHIRLVMFNVLYKKVPGPPKVLKNGKLSKDRSAPVTHGTYVAAIREHGLPVDEYAEHLDWLMYGDDRPRFFERDGSFRSVAQLDEFGDNLVHEMRDMIRVAKHPDEAYPNPSAFNCPSCPVRSICSAMLAREDAEAIIRNEYSVADPRR